MYVARREGDVEIIVVYFGELLLVTDEEFSLRGVKG